MRAVSGSQAASVKAVDDSGIATSADESASNEAVIENEKEETAAAVIDAAVKLPTEETTATAADGDAQESNDVLNEKGEGKRCDSLKLFLEPDTEKLLLSDDDEEQGGEDESTNDRSGQKHINHLFIFFYLTN